jgi:[ribosomal protein S5]-alanine N-acetyltransferase
MAMEITTERLILREFKTTDWPEVLAYQSEPLYLRYYEWTERNPKAVQEFVGMFLANQREQPRTKYQLAVTLKSSGQLIGNCGIRMKTVEARDGDIGYELSPKHWGQGYAIEAARAIVALGFTQFNLHRIWSWCVADNIGSVRVLQKLGMQMEGRLRENEYYKGRWWDTLMFGMLENEWKANVQAG